MRKKKITIEMIIIVLAIIGVIMFLNRPFYTLPIQGLEPAVENFTWNGIQGVIESPIFGTVRTEPGREFCGSNDVGDISLKNSYDTNNNKLNMSISITTGTMRPCGTNYIVAKITLPPGKLTGSCTSTVSNSPQTSGGNSGCIITGLYDFRLSPPEAQYLTESNNIGVNITETKEVEIIIDGIVASGGSLSTNLIIGFEKIDQNVSNGNMTNNTNNTTEEKIDVYRFFNNNCTLININKSSKGNNDYNNFSECAKNIIKQNITVYRIVDDECVPTSVKPLSVAIIDYPTLAECEENVKGFNWNLIALIGIPTGLVIVGGYILLKGRKKR